MKEYSKYISIDSEIRFGKPCIKGTRITIADILHLMAGGATHQEIIKDFPLLKEEHIYAALAFAANRESMIKMVAA